MTPQQTNSVLNASSMVKTTCGIGNNAAWMACLDAWDIIRQHPRIRKQQGSTTPYREFRKVFELLRRYELNLKWTNQCRFFHVADMPPETRKKFGDITDSEYYDFWAAFGFEAYAKTYNFLTCLQHKLYKAYARQTDRHPDILAWAMTAEFALDMAVDIYQGAIRVAVSDCPFPVGPYGLNDAQRVYSTIFKSFDLSHVYRQWCDAARMIGCDDYQLNETEYRDVKMGYVQLRDMWLDEETIFGSRIKVLEDYAEVFRTGGERKKAAREFAEMRDRVTALRKLEGQRVNYKEL